MYQTSSLSIEKDSQPIPEISRTKHWTTPGPPFRQPHGEPIPKQSRTLAVDPELELDLERVWCECESGPQPPVLRRAVLGQSNVFVRIDDRRSSEIEPSIL